MWFRNLQLYRFTQPIDASAENLQKALEEHEFRPCGALEMATFGWVAPLGRHSEMLVHAVGNYLMVTARKEEKLLPASVVNELLADRVAEVEEREMRSLAKRERDALREELVHELLPRAFTRSSLVRAYLAPVDGWLVVDAGSRKKAEELTVLLRRSLGSLPVLPPQTKERPPAVMSGWLRDAGSPAGWTVEDECELRAQDEGAGVVRCKRQDLSAEEVLGHLNAGKEVVKLAVTWNDRLSCVVDGDLQIKRLRFLDVVQEQAAEVVTDDEAERFDADFVILTQELAAFLPALLDVFGGEDTQAPERTAAQDAPPWVVSA